MSIGLVEKLFEPWRVLFRAVGAISQVATTLSIKNVQHARKALVSTKEAFAYFCLLTKVCRSQSAALRNAFDFNSHKDRTNSNFTFQKETQPTRDSDKHS
jgi:hypothetical protein